MYEYTLTGQLERVIDALGNKTEYRYDLCDRLIEIRQYGEASEDQETAEDQGTHGIDEALIRAQEQNKNTGCCHVTRYERDLSGQILSITDALGQKETYRYSKKGELLEKMDKEGYLTKYSYTAQGDVKQIQYADGREVKLSYNPLRQLQKIEDWLGITKIKNDTVGRATNIMYPDGSEVSYTYGASGERTSITYPDGKTVHYGYDEHLRLSELKEGDRIITYGYDQRGDLVHKQFPNGMETSYQYNSKGQLTGLFHRDKDGVLDAYRYGYDNLGNKTSIEKQRRGLNEECGSFHYGYDAIGRLSEVRKDGILKSAYTYDAFGNRLGKLELGTDGGKRETTYRYNALNQLIKKTGIEGEETYTYDKRGNLSQIIRSGQVRNEYLYGALNRLEEARNHKGDIARYAYNGLGHRIGKKTGLAEIPQVQTERSLDPMNHLREQRFVPTGKIDYTIDFTRQYHNLLQSREENDASGQTQTYLWDEHAASVYTQIAYTAGSIEEGLHIHHDYYLQDDLGSPVRLLDQDGAVKETYGYDEFGRDLYQYQGNFQPFGYTGYQMDHIAGSYYAQAREYRPEAGRFMSEDMIKGYTHIPLTMNVYAYAFSAPMDYVDLDGQWPKIPNWGKIAIGVGAIAIGVAVTVATGGAAAPAILPIIGAGLKTAAIVGGISAATSAGITAVSSAISGDNLKTGAKKTLQAAWDGFADGFMVGGITFGASSTLHPLLSKSEGLKIIKTAKERYGRLTIGYGADQGGFTLANIANKAGKSLGRLDFDFFNYFHFHYGTTNKLRKLHRTGIFEPLLGGIAGLFSKLFGDNKDGDKKMFVNMNNNVILYKKLGTVYYLEVRGFNEQNSADRNFLLDLIKYISSDKNVFIGFTMGEFNAFDEESILNSVKNPNRRYSGRLNINLSKFKITEKIFENGSTTFYIFNKSIKWEEFSKMKNPSHARLITTKRLLATVTLYDMGSPTITISQDCDIELKYIFEQFNSQGFSIHRDKEGVLDAYRYGYDSLGNKGRIEKQRRGLEEESGSYSYGYDPIGRLAEGLKRRQLNLLHKTRRC